MTIHLGKNFRAAALAASAGLTLYGGSEMIKNYPIGEAPEMIRQQVCMNTPGADCSAETAQASQALIARGLSTFGGEALAGAELVGAVLLLGGAGRKFKVTPAA